MVVENPVLESRVSKMVVSEEKEDSDEELLPSKVEGQLLRRESRASVGMREEPSLYENEGKSGP